MNLPPKIFDREQVARNLRRRGGNDRDFITQLVLDDLADRLLAVTRTIGKALLLSPDARLMPESGATHNGTFKFERLATVLASDEAVFVDAENLSLPRDDYDLIVSLLDLQVVNDVPGYLNRIRAHLAPDGLFLAAFPGGMTLTELRQAFLAADADIHGGAFARVAPFIQLGDAGGLLQRAGFALPVTDVETHTVRYADALALMRDLRGLGAANPLIERPRQLTRRALIGAALAAYQDIAGDADGRVRASLEIVWLSGWAPHESQQKPLKPGSAKVALRSVLKDKAGD